MKYLTLILTLLLLWGGSATAQSEPKWKVDWSTETEARARHYTRSLATPYQQQWEILVQQGLRLQKGEKLSFTGTLNGSLNARHAARSRVWLNEAYVTWRKGRIVAKAGKQTLRWGTLSGFSALDLLNRYDYYDLLDTDAERLGLWGLDLRWSLGSATELNLQVFPDQNRSRLHLQDNRWVHLPARLYLPDLPVDGIPFRNTAVVDSTTTQFPAISIGLDTEIGRFNTQLTAFYGPNDIPQSSVVLQNLATTSADYHLLQQYHHIGMGALQMSTFLGNWNLALEGAYVHSKRLRTGRELVDDNYLFTSIGVDRVWFFDNPEQQLKLVAQVLWGHSLQGYTYGPAELDHVFHRSTLLQLDWRINYRWEVGMQHVQSWAPGGYYLRPQIRFRANDHLQFWLRADVLGGDEQHFFGYHNSNDRLALHLKLFPFSDNFCGPKKSRVKND